MKQRTVNVYTFDELSEKAKERAKLDYASKFGYAWADEAIASLDALAEHFGGKLANYEVDFFDSPHSSARFDMPELDESEIVHLLSQLGSFNDETLRGDGDCKLTSFCADEDAIDGFRKAFYDGERDVKELMQAAFNSWLSAARSDCEDQYSDEQFSEHCQANGYEFYENGKFA